MEVDNVNFWGHLPTILDAIADAEFISLSVIGYPDAIIKANQTMEELYHELAEHSKIYHISKIGLTCFQYDAKQKGTYDVNFLAWVFTEVTDIPSLSILCT